MSDWLNRVAANLLSLSESDSVAAALREWHYTGYVVDYEEPIEACQLCDQQGLRWHFQIQHEPDDNTLLVGSECIKRFGITGVDEYGNPIDADETTAKMGRDRSRLLAEARVRRVLNTLIRLAQLDDDMDLEDFVLYYHDHKAFTPKQMFTIQWRAAEYHIKLQASDFKVTLKKQRWRDDLINMEDWKLKKIEPFLSPSQKQKRR